MLGHRINGCDVQRGNQCTCHSNAATRRGDAKMFNRCANSKCLSLKSAAAKAPVSHGCVVERTKSWAREFECCTLPPGLARLLQSTARIDRRCRCGLAAALGTLTGAMTTTAGLSVGGTVAADGRIRANSQTRNAIAGIVARFTSPRRHNGPSRYEE
jgi:hypothetical protein